MHFIVGSASVSNFLRLLKLPTTCQQWLVDRRLDMGHAKVLLSLPQAEQFQAGQIIIQKGLSVRQSERLIRQLNVSVDSAAYPDLAYSVRVNQLSKELTRMVGKPVNVKLKKGGSGKGMINLPFHSLDELESIVTRLKHHS